MKCLDPRVLSHMDSWRLAWSGDLRGHLGNRDMAWGQLPSSPLHRVVGKHHAWLLSQRYSWGSRMQAGTWAGGTPLSIWSGEAADCMWDLSMPPGKWTVSAGAMQGPPWPFTGLPGCLELKCYQGRRLQPPYRRSGATIASHGHLGTRSEQWEGKVVSVAAHQTDRQAEAGEARQEGDVIAGLRWPTSGHQGDEETQKLWGLLVRGQPAKGAHRKE